MIIIAAGLEIQFYSKSRFLHSIFHKFNAWESNIHCITSFNITSGS